jgi:hypothetical protein
MQEGLSSSIEHARIMSQKKLKMFSELPRIFSYLLIALGYSILVIYQSLLMVVPNDIASDAPKKYPRNEAMTVERDRYDLAIKIGKDISDRMPNLALPALLLGCGYYLHKISSKKSP